ncbi:DUF4426 domain-containing protein [Solemya velesiana gill symbiont]|uniref:Orotate phosphoribosyltransferase n=1 Tax=Solemya velesiana gill symbiont TaxID=1918948 RepID=A0A1T2KVE7_9GAMM|nr:DUF4426 domain-containing protein [Solemya velesiana gill symbiont]OOZ36792.1 orotate phosphoribosyltransferase [Solemya velesiana gill symbiont]
MTHAIQSVLVALLMLLPFTTVAENSTQGHGYTVHHNAIPDTTLSPEIAKQYGLVRSKYRGMLNVSVIKEVPGTTGTPVTAQVKARSTNLIGQMREIDLREIREGEAVYYIGDFPITNLETLTFRLEVTPKGFDKTIKAQLTQQFFID